MPAFVQDLPDGSTFVATKRHVPEFSPFGNFDGSNPEALSAWVVDKWNMLFQMKRHETARLKTCQAFKDGFHYEDPWDNRNEPVVNYCHSTVETIWPILTQVRPRPKPVPRNAMDSDRIKALADYATYKMDCTNFDYVFGECVRDLLKFGWCCPMLGWDARGNSLMRYLSPFDFYADSATEESELEMFAIARPAMVRRLRALFPKVADKIQPDNIASPLYDATTRLRIENYGLGGRFALPQIIGTGTMPSAVFEGDPAATSTGNYVLDTGSFQNYGLTAFLIQLFVRDYTTMPVKYEGTRFIPHATGPLRIPHTKTMQEPCCPSGWRMIPMLANGVLLDLPRPVDECVGGIPVVIGRNYYEGGSFYAKGELDDVIPIQRDINFADSMIRRSLELQANPPVKVSLDARLSVDKNAVEGGEIIRIARGATMEYLQPNSVAESQFERRTLRRQDIQIIGGTPDSLQGQRPVGVEAGTAMRTLIESGSSRARAKGPQMLQWAALMLEKMIHSDLKKSHDIVRFQTSDGRNVIFNPQDFDPSDFNIRWASESGDAQGQQDRVDLDKELLQLGVIDAQQLLEDLDYPNRTAILARLAQNQLQRQKERQHAMLVAEQEGNVSEQVKVG